jgi:hypothetical protein
MGVVFPHAMHTYQRIPTTGTDLRAAFDAVMAGAVVSGLQYSLQIVLQHRLESNDYDPSFP